MQEGGSGSPDIHKVTGNAIAIHSDGGRDEGEGSDGTDDGGTKKGARLEGPGLTEHLTLPVGAAAILCGPVLGLIMPSEIFASSRAVCEAMAELGDHSRESYGA